MLLPEAEGPSIAIVIGIKPAVFLSWIGIRSLRGAAGG